MLKLLWLPYLLFVSCSIFNPGAAKTQAHIDAIFVAWNKSSLESLSRQMNGTTDSARKSMYANRLSAVKEYWRIKRAEDVSVESVRYKLLQTLLVDQDVNMKNFYIVEANESGSKVLLKSFVLHLDSDNQAEVDLYEFNNGDWNKSTHFQKSGVILQDDLTKYISRFGNGVNQDDVIITEFKDTQVSNSEYYLYSTLSKESGIKDVLEWYRK